MKKNNILISIAIVIAASLTSCVPAKKLEDEQARRKSCEEDLTASKAKQSELEELQKAAKEKLEIFGKRIGKMEKDSTELTNNNKTMAAKYDKLNAVNEQLLDKYNKMMEVNINDTKKISSELQGTQSALLKKQDELRALEDSLNKKQRNLDGLKVELLQREQKISEMQDILTKKDQAVADLKKKVTDALLGFENKGLTISQKNGKVYVSLDESLLFASGKTNIEPKGADALKKLAKVLEQNTDINVIVEGHTDNVPMKGTGDIKDNWDLSAMRATSIVKIITGNSNTDPKRLTAAGRGEYYPLEKGNTAESRKKNRRTEIILTPKLDELFKILENN